MERYWCLRWLAQQDVKQVDAVVLKDELVRLADIPLVIKMPGMPQLARGAHIKLDLIRWDEIELTVEARLLEVTSTGTDDAIAELEEEDEVVPSEVETTVDEPQATPEDAADV